LYHGQRRLDEAKAKYEELARHQDKPVVAMTFLGMISELQNDKKGARTRYERALELDHNAGIAANNLAWIFADSNENLDVALQLAQTAKAQFPDVPQVNDTLGWVYYKKGMATMAVTFLREATKRGPSNPSMQYRLGLAYLKAGDKRNARASLEEALKLNPQFEQADDAKRTLETIIKG
jgi:Tfp pilus assembly protein PilF